MDTFRALNELATIDAAASRALAALGDPPANPAENDRREQLHARACLAINVARDRAGQARIAVEKLDPQEVLG